MNKKVIVILCSIFALIVITALIFCIISRDSYLRSTAEPISFTKLCNITDQSLRGALIVDNNTQIVYINIDDNGPISGIAPYLAPNGQPYTYDKSSKSLFPLPSYQNEEIPDSWIIKLK